MNILDQLDAKSLRSDVPDFRPGDTLNEHVNIGLQVPREAPRDVVEVDLAGSVHALPKEHAHFPEQLERAYEAAKVVMLEVDLDDMNPLDAVQFIAANGTLPAEQSLADVVGDLLTGGVDAEDAARLLGLVVVVRVHGGLDGHDLQATVRP